jgi:hypothetical protein
MTLINDSSWSLQLETSGLIPLVFEEPEDFIHEICGKILRRENQSERDQVVGRLRIYRPSRHCCVCDGNVRNTASYYDVALTMLGELRSGISEGYGL